MERKRNSCFAIALIGLLGVASVSRSSLAAGTTDDAADEKGRTPVTEAAGEKVRTPTFGEMLGASGIEIGGYVDTSYTYSGNKNVTFNNNSNNPNDPKNTPNRVDDRQPNSFNFNMAELSVAMQPNEGFGGAMVLNIGTDADVTAATGSGKHDNFDVQQAFISYKTDGMQLMLGKFATLVGAEVIESPDNMNFSRSILFGYAIPFTNTGVRLHYDINDMISTVVGVNNGWNNLKDNNKQKSIEAAVSITPSDVFSLSVQGTSGFENGVANGAGVVQQGNRSLLDIVATVNATEHLTFVVNTDYAVQNRGTVTGAAARWWGVAGYGNYQFSDRWRLAVRGEFFDDRAGFRTGIKQKWKEVTTTLAYAPTEHVELRGEYRHDWSNRRSFLKSNGVARKLQDTAALEAIFKF